MVAYLTTAAHYRLIRRALAVLAGSILLILAWFILIRPAIRTESAKSETTPLSSLPSDVVYVIKDFNYRETVSGSAVEIDGRLSVMRGKKVMAFRSNFAKGTFLEGISGKISSHGREIRFQADRGEWDSRNTSPFLLFGNVSLIVGGKSINGAERLQLLLDRKMIVADGKPRTTYSF